MTTRPAIALALLALAACQREERVISHRTILSGLPDAKSATPDSPPITSKFVENSKAVPDDRLIIEEPNGRVRLIAKSPRHLMIHIYGTLDANNDDLFVDQVLSARSKSEYAHAGRDPRESFKSLKARRDDLEQLFSRMPMGEGTPGVRFDNLGANTFRLRLPASVAQDLNWIGIDMVLEQGNWRLRWFVPGE